MNIAVSVPSESNTISANERATLQGIINALEVSSSMSGMDVYIHAAYQFTKADTPPSEETIEILRSIKRQLDNNNPRYTREHIMTLLGITIPDRAAPTEESIDQSMTTKRRQDKMTTRPKKSAFALLNPEGDREDGIQVGMSKTTTPKPRPTTKKKTPTTAMRDHESHSAGLPSQKILRIAEVAQKRVATIPDVKKTPEEIEQHAALIAYLTEDFLNHDAYFPSITEVSFNKHGCPVILQTYRERLSGMRLTMVDKILDKIGDFIFKKPVAQ